jgi:hypothetical protein
MKMLNAKAMAVMLVISSSLLLANLARAGQASSYTETNLSDGQCEQYAYNIVTGGGFTNIEVKNPTVSFNSGPYECGARCILKHNIVFFYCVGQTSGGAHEIVEYMKNNGQWMR